MTRCVSTARKPTCSPSHDDLCQIYRKAALKIVQELGEEVFPEPTPVPVPDAASAASNSEESAGETTTTVEKQDAPSDTPGAPETSTPRSSAEEDSERILKEHVPKDHRVHLSWPAHPRDLSSLDRSSFAQIHIHCYTDSPEWAARMLAHFPNLYIGITGSYCT